MNNLKTTEGNIPKYEQARRRLIKYIEAMPPDAEYLPFEYELVEMFGISRVCIRRALAELRNDGIIQTVRNRGSKVLRRDINLPGSSPGLSLASTPTAAIFPADTQEAQPTDFFTWRIAGQLEHLIQAQGGSMEYINVRRSRKAFLSPEEVLQHMIERRIRWALIITHHSLETDRLVRPMLTQGIKPLIYLNGMQYLEKNCEALFPGTDYVADNQNLAIYETLMTRFQNCDYVAVLANSDNMDWAGFRAETIRRFASRNDMEYELLVDELAVPKGNPYHANKADTIASGSRLIDDILPKLKAARRPLVFGANDCFALGALQRLQELGLRCPEDVEVLGFDNMAEAQASNLSTFATNAEVIATTAFKSLTRFLETPEASLADGIGRLTTPLFCDRNTTQ